MSRRRDIADYLTDILQATKHIPAALEPFPGPELSYS